jgi:SAM-dependent methyltransferase
MGFFDTAYEGRPPWDIGRPQGAIVSLAEAGEIVGSVIDLGCGTGEHALYLAERGHPVLGIDLAEGAVETARSKAAERAVPAEFLVWDARRAHELGRRFDTAIDVGLFHTLSDEDRLAYASALHGVLQPGGRGFVLCWSERNPWGSGPRRVSQMELLGTFERDWTDVSIEERTYETLLDRTIHAWLLRLTRS